jgi:large subunit ribosomal protein L28
VPLEQVPEYPYGRFQTYKQRNEGLYGRSKIRFGNVVAEKYKNKSRTTWLPNRHTKRLWSVALNGFIRTRMTASVLHTIDRLGGIDEYLLGNKAKRIKELGPAGWRLRWKIMQTDAVKARFAKERAILGLPPKAEKGIDADTTFPAELVAEGLNSKAVLDEVDAMLERGDEFVLGDPNGEAEDVVEDVQVGDEGRHTPQQGQKPE